MGTQRIQRTQLTDPVAWLGTDLEPDDGLVLVSPECLAELNELVRTLRRNPLPLTALSVADFRLSACSAMMAAARTSLRDGLGFVLLDRLPVNEWSTDEARAVSWLLCSMIDRPVAQKWDGTMIYDVRDNGKPVGNGVRADVTNAEQNFHTDNSYNLCPPWYVALLCLNTAQSGGVSSIVSFYAAHNEMLATYPDLLARLYGDYLFDRQREHASDDDLVIKHPVFEFADDRLIARLSYSLIVGGYQLSNEAIDPQGQQAIDVFQTILNRDGATKSFNFEPGQLQIVDNRRCGHRRTGFQDWPEPARKRHLIRLWLRGSGRAFYHG